MQVDAKVGNISTCPIYYVDFVCRVRLVTHLADTRIRSKFRGTCCNSRFLAFNPADVGQCVLDEVHSSDRKARSAAVKAGRSHVIAIRPCIRPPKIAAPAPASAKTKRVLTTPQRDRKSLLHRNKRADRVSALAVAQHVQPDPLAVVAPCVSKPAKRIRGKTPAALVQLRD